MKKKIQIYLEDWAIDELDQILKSPLCQNRGFKMKRGDVIEELIANFTTDWEEMIISPNGQESH